MSYEREMITKDELVDAIDDELSEFEESKHIPDRDGGFFHKLEILTYTRNAIYNMPVNITWPR